MTLGFDFHPEARTEFMADVEWYDARDLSVGERFENAVRSAVIDAVKSPESWPHWPDWHREPVVRSRGVSGFPYRVVYFVRGELLTVVAVAHEKRRPGYWRDRVISDCSGPRR